MVVTQSCLTLCDPLDCSPPGSSGERRKDTGVSNPSLLQWIFLTQGWNPRHLSSLSLSFPRVLSLLGAPLAPYLPPGPTSSPYFPGAHIPRSIHSAPWSRPWLQFLQKRSPKQFIPTHIPHLFFEEQGLFWCKCN